MIVGIAGGSASGKTTVVERLRERLGADTAAAIPHDRYYRDLSDQSADARAATNFDHPDALETELLVAHLDALRAGRSVDAPVYDFTQHVREQRTDRVEPRAVILVEGVLVLADARLRSIMDLKVFVDTGDEARYARRLRRDLTERGRTIASVEAQYAGSVRPMHERFVEPSRRHADIVVADGGFNGAAIQALADEIRRRLAARRGD